MGMHNNPDATKFQVCTPVPREMIEAVDAARLPLRLSRSAFAKKALAAYVEQIAREAA
jgi:hypothetical protein